MTAGLFRSERGLGHHNSSTRRNADCVDVQMQHGKQRRIGRDTFCAHASMHKLAQPRCEICYRFDGFDIAYHSMHFTTFTRPEQEYI